MWFLIVIGAIIVIFGIAVLVMKQFMKKLMAERAPEERRYPSEGGKKALLLYQPTRHDTADRYAEQIAEGLNARGYDVTVNYAAASLGYDPKDYELLIFGTGAYMGMAAFPVRRYLREHPFERRQVVLFSVGSNLQADPEIEQLRAELAHGNLVYRIKVSRGQEDVMADFLQRLELDDPDFDSIAEEEPEEEPEEDGEDPE